jgi:hypothetical protein
MGRSIVVRDSYRTVLLSGLLDQIVVHFAAML